MGSFIPPYARTNHEVGKIEVIIMLVAIWYAFILPVAWTICDIGVFKLLITILMRVKMVNEYVYSGTLEPSHKFKIYLISMITGIDIRDNIIKEILERL